MKHSLAHLQDLIPTLAGVVACMFYIPAKVRIKSCRCASLAHLQDLILTLASI